MDVTEALAILDLALGITRSVTGGKVGGSIELAQGLEQLVGKAVEAYQKEVGQPMDLTKYHHQDHV